MTLNRERSLRLLAYSRQACIPLVLLGGWFACLLAREVCAIRHCELFAMTLWVFDPMIMSHGALITNDVAATTAILGASLACIRWMRRPTRLRSLVLGISVGLCLVTKFTLLVVPVVIALFQVIRCYPSSPGRRLVRWLTESLVHVGMMVVVSVLLVNMVYRIGSVSSLILNSGKVIPSAVVRIPPWQRTVPARTSLLGWLPIPKTMLTGIQQQHDECQRPGVRSYWNGAWRDSGWPGFYLSGLLVKIPHGTQVLLLLWLIGCRATARNGSVPVVIALSFGLLVLLSAHTTITHHVRYALPAWGLLLIFAGAAASSCLHPARSRWMRWLACIGFVSAIASPLATLPYNLGYFNELSGGAWSGYRHLVLSNCDWGQDAGVAADHAVAVNGQGRPVVMEVLYDTLPVFGFQSVLSPHQGWSVMPYLKSSPDGIVVVSATGVTLDSALYQDAIRPPIDRKLFEITQVTPTMFLISNKSMHNAVKALQ